MQMKPLAFFVGLALLFGGAECKAADLITVPPDLNPGDQYRLVFVTDGERDATSTDINVYNAFVNDAALAIPELAALNTNWKAIASTSTVDANVNTGTVPSKFAGGSVGFPIFRFDGIKVVDDYDDLWDGYLDNGIIITEKGIIVPKIPELGPPRVWAWTGTNANSGYKEPTVVLGNPPVGLVSIAEVHLFTPFALWTQIGFDEPENSYRLFAISGVLSVPPIPVDIDIKPGSDRNLINLKSKGKLQVAILTTNEFDVLDIDDDTLRFGDPELVNVPSDGVMPVKIVLADVDDDGDQDLLLFFSVLDLIESGALDEESVCAKVTGATLDDAAIEGTDFVLIKEKKK